MALAPVTVYTLIGPDGTAVRSHRPGKLGGHRTSRVYGLLDCPAALRALAHGGYVRDRVFFADEQTAVAAGFRPCGACLPEQYRHWKAGTHPSAVPSGDGSDQLASARR
ncbi:Ada metal-binding domain-containing protein [uncultured Friedmanniella sp.]|uniref:Ada metal-binding domain-containing protein n=1 Tax=uncultured Friedmanniella sp. TaxID=335381 RepID=UPI0035CAB142